MKARSQNRPTHVDALECGWNVAERQRWRLWWAVGLSVHVISGARNGVAQKKYFVHRPAGDLSRPLKAPAKLGGPNTAFSHYSVLHCLPCIMESLALHWKVHQRGAGTRPTAVSGLLAELRSTPHRTSRGRVELLPVDEATPPPSLLRHTSIDRVLATGVRLRPLLQTSDSPP